MLYFLKVLFIIRNIYIKLFSTVYTSFLLRDTFETCIHNFKLRRGPARTAACSGVPELLIRSQNCLPPDPGWGPAVLYVRTHSLSSARSLRAPYDMGVLIHGNHQHSRKRILRRYSHDSTVENRFSLLYCLNVENCYSE
jgi:hypothetical protein